jgi:hypothetical protein
MDMDCLPEVAAGVVQVSCHGCIHSMIDDNA